MPFAPPLMDLEMITLSKSERQMPYDITYMWYLKYDQNELMKQRFTKRENQLMVIKWERQWGRGKLRVWDQQMQTSIYKIKKALLYSTW